VYSGSSAGTCLMLVSVFQCAGSLLVFSDIFWYLLVSVFQGLLVPFELKTDSIVGILNRQVMS
jgi:hypothetical protein